MNKIFKYFLYLLFFFFVNTSYSQEKKITKVQKLILIEDFKTANDLILKILDKNPDLSCAIYYSALVDFKLGKSIDTILNKLDACDVYFKSISRDQCFSDSITYNYSKIKIDTFRMELSDFAFNKYYKFSNTIDSLDLFKKKFKTSKFQNSYINDRICLIAVNKILISTSREVIINFITNYKECGQIDMVKLQLEQLDWQIANNSNTKLSYSLFASNYPISKYSDSLREKIEIITWKEVLIKDSLVVYLNYINTHPNSTFLVLAKRSHDELLWKKTNIKVDIINMQKYIDECIECEFKDQALDNIANLEWNLIIDTKDTIVLNEFLRKRINFSKIDLVKKRKLMLIDNNVKNKKVVLDSKIYDSWKQKLALYDKSKTQYVRTKVFSTGNLGVMDRVQQNIDFLLRVDEVFVGDYNDILYSTKYENNDPSNLEYEPEKLVANYNDVMGLEISNIYIAQQISENYFSIGFSGRDGSDIVFNSKSGDLALLRMPKYNFTFNKFKPFPYLRVGCPDYLFSSKFNRSINNEYRPEYYNSDLIYSIENQNLFCLINSGIGMQKVIGSTPIFSTPNRYEINFGSGDQYFEINNELYDIKNLKKLELNFDRLINGDKFIVENGRVGHEKIPAPIVAFNDSLCISYYEKEKILKIYYLGTEKVDTVQLNTNLFFGKLEHIEIDQIGKYLYIESKFLQIYDCQIKKFVYLGPYIGIDHTMEKIGWVMTKAFYCNKKESVKMSQKKLESVEKFGFEQWKLINYQPPIAKYRTKGGQMAKPPMASNPGVLVLERSLINLSSLMNIDFQKDLEKKIMELIPAEDIFNVNRNAYRKYFLRDSLISCSHLWAQGHGIELPNVPITVNQNVADNLSIARHLEKYDGNYLTNPEVPYLQEFIPRLLSFERNGDVFTFSFRIDSLPSDLLELNPQIQTTYLRDLKTDKNMNAKKGYVNSIELDESHVCDLVNGDYSIVKIDSNFFSYNFELITDKEEIGQLINNIIKDKNITIVLMRNRDKSSLLNSLEVAIIDEYFESSKLNREHYWMEILNKCKIGGIGVEEVSLDLKFNTKKNNVPQKIPHLLYTRTGLSMPGIYE